MASVYDVAQYILEQAPGKKMSAIKLQKLVYYCQAWHLAWEGYPLFNEEIQAWANGPVVPALYERHRGQLEVSADQHIGDAASLTADEARDVDDILPAYMDKKPFWLVELTHLERPWREARGNCPPGHVCTNPINLATMAEYYSGLAQSNG